MKNIWGKNSIEKITKYKKEEHYDIWKWTEQKINNEQMKENAKKTNKQNSRNKNKQKNKVWKIEHKIILLFWSVAVARFQHGSSTVAAWQ